MKTQMIHYTFEKPLTRAHSDLLLARVGNKHAGVIDTDRAGDIVGCTADPVDFAAFWGELNRQAALRCAAQTLKVAKTKKRAK